MGVLFFFFSTKNFVRNTIFMKCIFQNILSLCKEKKLLSLLFILVVE